uniref:Uncharacterized protein n=1 Tax=Anopheles atroparvus TaxID=41427 RepID=A0A182IVK3_ANOAO
MLFSCGVERDLSAACGNPYCRLYSGSNVASPDSLRLLRVNCSLLCSFESDALRSSRLPVSLRWRNRWSMLSGRKSYGRKEALYSEDALARPMPWVVPPSVLKLDRQSNKLAKCVSVGDPYCACRTGATEIVSESASGRETVIGTSSALNRPRDFSAAALPISVPTFFLPPPLPPPSESLAADPCREPLLGRSLPHRVSLLLPLLLSGK